MSFCRVGHSLRMGCMAVLAALLMAVGCSEGQHESDSQKRAPQGRTYESLFQKAIDYSWLQRYLFPDEPSRFTLCVAGNMLPEGLELWKFGRQVKVVNPPDTCDNCIYFLEARFHQDTAVVFYRYPIEGFFATLTFVADSSAWLLVDSVSGFN